MAETTAEQSLPNPITAEGNVVIRRVFDAPRELVWKVYTERDHLMRWWGPKSFTTFAATLDLRPGGIFHYGMRSPDGHEMWGRWLFREIVSPERLVYILSFADEDGNAIRPSMVPVWPLELLSTTTFTEHERKTTVTIYTIPLNASDEEWDAFEAERSGMEEGFNGTLDKLEAYLATNPEEQP